MVSCHAAKRRLAMCLVIAACAGASAEAMSWERVERVAVYRSPLRARYPSIVKTPNGSLLVLFTRQTPAEYANDAERNQEGASRGALLLARSADGGKNWSQADVLHRSRTGQPRAMGTMTVLQSGRIVAPFAEWSEWPESKPWVESVLGLLSSEDGGKTWSVLRPQVDSPLVWLSPYGRLIETEEGHLAMAVYGAASKADLKGTIHGCGLLRSTDGGQSWGDFSWIMKGNRPIIGALPSTKFSFEAPALQNLSDGRWLAVVNARRLGTGPGAPTVLVRLWSKDGGRTWSEPEQLTVGAWPCLASASGADTVCGFSLWASWGSMCVMFSDNGFESFYQEAPLLGRGWLSGIKGWQKRLSEIPIWPPVPYLERDWDYEHYGFPSAIALDEDRLAVVIGRTQHRSLYWDYHDVTGERQIPIKKERIDVVFYERRPSEAATPAGPPAGKGARPTGRWVLAERSKTLNFFCVTPLPDGDLLGFGGAEKQPPLANPTEQGYHTFKLVRSADGARTWTQVEGATIPGAIAVLGVLRSGRWLAVTGRTGKDRIPIPNPQIVGTRGGYPIMKYGGGHVDRDCEAWYSDDQARTWRRAGVLRSPLHDCVAFGRFIETQDGTVCLSVYGCLSDADARVYASSNGLFRSTDGGRSWGDFSLIASHGPQRPDDLQPEPRYTELDVLPLPDGRWMAIIRTEYGLQGPKAGIASPISLCYSSDQGRTWTKPVEPFLGGGMAWGQVLPDGGVAILTRSNSWQMPGLYISYDGGRTWSYALAGPFYTWGLQRVGQDRLVAFSANQRDTAAYRWVPDE